MTECWTIAIASAPPSWIGSRSDFVQQHERGAPGWRSVDELLMCAENKAGLAAMDCASPMSAKTVQTREAEPISPGVASLRHQRKEPAVFNATVLPPVFGPVISGTRFGGSKADVNRDGILDHRGAPGEREPGLSRELARPR